MDKAGTEHTVTVENHLTDKLSAIRIYTASDHSEYEEYGLSVSVVQFGAQTLYRATTDIPTIVGGSSGDDALLVRVAMMFFLVTTAMTTFRVVVVMTSSLEVLAMTVILSMREMIKLRLGEALTH